MSVCDALSAVSLFAVTVLPFVFSEADLYETKLAIVGVFCLYILPMQAVWGSMFGLLALSVDRVLYIHWPLRYPLLVTQRRIALQLVSAFLLSLFLAVVPLSWTKLPVTSFPDLVEFFPLVNRIAFFTVWIATSVGIIGTMVSIEVTAQKHRSKMQRGRAGTRATAQKNRAEESRASIGVPVRAVRPLLHAVHCHPGPPM